MFDTSSNLRRKRYNECTASALLQSVLILTGAGSAAAAVAHEYIIFLFTYGTITAKVLQTVLEPGGCKRHCGPPASRTPGLETEPSPLVCDAGVTLVLVAPVEEVAVLRVVFSTKHCGWARLPNSQKPQWRKRSGQRRMGVAQTTWASR